MTDAAAAARLRSALDAMPAIPPNSTLAAAIGRAIELLEREASHAAKIDDAKAAAEEEFYQ